jgi:hypothetical protein
VAYWSYLLSWGETPSGETSTSPSTLSNDKSFFLLFFNPSSL